MRFHHVVCALLSLQHSAAALQATALARRGSRIAVRAAVRAAAPEAPGKYGGDPRVGLEVTADAEWMASVAPGTIGELSSVEQLQAAVDTAAQSSALVVLKFKRADCAACASTNEQYLAAAEELGATGNFFFTVDYDEARAFCKTVKVKFVPSGQIYADGELRAALGMGPKKWDDFRETLDEFERKRPAT